MPRPRPTPTDPENTRTRRPRTRAELKSELADAREGLTTVQTDLQQMIARMNEAESSLPSIAYTLMLAQASLAAIQAEYDQERHKLTETIAERARLHGEVQQAEARVHELHDELHSHHSHQMLRSALGEPSGTGRKLGRKPRFTRSAAERRRIARRMRQYWAAKRREKKSGMRRDQQ